MKWLLTEFRTDIVGKLDVLVVNLEAVLMPGFQQ